MTKLSDEDPANKGSASFKVEDKRGFNSDGSERAAEPYRSEVKPDTESTADFILKDSEDAAESPSAGGAEEVNFVSFMMSLATQGMMQLGEMAAPAGHAVPVNLEHAKQTIDILSMLQDKTRGNLDEFEAGLIEEVLHSLRMAYVAKKKK